MKRISSLRIGAAFLLIPALIGLSRPVEAKPSLAGKKYEVELTESGKTSKDTLIFTKKEFESLQCRQYGFKPAKYRVTGTADSIAFESESKSKTEGKNTWSGYVKGGTIKTTLVWQKQGQSDKVYQGTGMEMPEPQASRKAD